MELLTYTQRELFKDIEREKFTISPKIRTIANHCIKHHTLSRGFFNRLEILAMHNVLDFKNYIKGYLDENEPDRKER